jgi:hypothetical protein
MDAYRKQAAQASLDPHCLQACCAGGFAWDLSSSDVSYEGPSVQHRCCAVICALGQLFRDATSTSFVIYVPGWAGYLQVKAPLVRVVDGSAIAQASSEYLPRDWSSNQMAGLCGAPGFGKLCGIW